VAARLSNELRSGCATAASARIPTWCACSTCRPPRSNGSATTSARRPQPHPRQAPAHRCPPPRPTSTASRRGRRHRGRLPAPGRLPPRPGHRGLLALAGTPPGRRLARAARAPRLFRQLTASADPRQLTRVS
jgi:hypothetical protein